MPNRRRTSVPTVTDMQPGKMLTLAQAAALIASRTADGRDTMRSACDRARHKLSNHVQRRKLRRLPGGRFAVAELGRWLNDNAVNPGWSGLFVDVPANIESMPATGSIQSTGFAPLVIQLPGTLAGSHAEIKRLNAEIARLQAEVARLRDD